MTTPMCGHRLTIGGHRWICVLPAGHDQDSLEAAKSRHPSSPPAGDGPVAAAHYMLTRKEARHLGYLGSHLRVVS